MIVRGVITMPYRRAVLGAIFVVVASASAKAQPAIPSAAVVDVQGGQISVVTIATGLVHPWSIALLPGDRSMLVVERNGRVRLIDDGTLVAEPVWSADGVA